MSGAPATDPPLEETGPQPGDLPAIRTPDQRVRVFVSSTLQELAPERAAARDAIAHLRLTPILFELGARPHPPRALYRAYLEQSDIFVAIYWERYGWVAPGMTISGLEDEYQLSGGKPRLIYVKDPAPGREPGLRDLLHRVQVEEAVSYQHFAAADELRELIENDLAVLLTERFQQGRAPAPPATVAPARPHHNLPAERSPIIGRDQEAAATCDLLRRADVGLVTLTGPGGAGKTRLALHVATQLLDFFADGVFFVSLAPITDPDLILPTIAATLQVQATPGNSLTVSLKDYLRARHLLLVLDNFEQVVAGAPLVTDLLDACPRLTVLATSRTPLHLHDEKEVPVPPLTLPDPARLPETDHLSQYAAVALFIQRALDVKPDFAVTNENAPAVAEICARLDGLPLAIELAAARVKLLPPQAMLDRLKQPFKLLTGGARDLPARQQTLRNTIEWSYGLLDEQEQKLFRRMAVFAGGCTLAAVEAVCNAGGDLALDVLDGAGSLIDKSMIRQGEAGAEEPRFWMLETIREYGLDRLADSGEATAIRRQHADYYVRFAEQAEPQLLGPEQLRYLAYFDAERANLRAVMDWSREASDGVEIGIRLAGTMQSYWQVRAFTHDARQWLVDMLARPGAEARTPARAAALRALGRLAFLDGDSAAGQTALEESVAMWRELGNGQGLNRTLMLLGTELLVQSKTAAARTVIEESVRVGREAADTWGLAGSLYGLGLTDSLGGDLLTARAHFEESLALFRQTGDRWGAGWPLFSLAEDAYRQGDLAGAQARLAEALAIWQRPGNETQITTLLQFVGGIAEQQGKYEQAAAQYAEGLSLHWSTGDRRSIADSLEALARIANLQDQAERAAHLLGAAEALRTAAGVPLPAAQQGQHDQCLAAVRTRLTEPAFAAAWAEGRAMTTEQAVKQALEQTLAASVAPGA